MLILVCTTKRTLDNGRTRVYDQEEPSAIGFMLLRMDVSLDTSSKHACGRGILGEWGQGISIWDVGGESESEIHRSLRISLYSDHFHYAQNTYVPS